MAEVSAEIWKSTLGGVTQYAACGPREVLIIVSNCSISSPEVVPRNEGKLSAADKNRLTSEGIPSECWMEDLKLTKARFTKESSRFKEVLILDDSHLKKEKALRKIEEFLDNSKQPGGKI